MLLVYLGLALLAAPHPDSISSSRVELDGVRASVLLRCQLRSLEEVIDGLDADGNELVSEQELEQRSAEVREYLLDHYRLIVGSDRDLQGGEELECDAFQMRWLPPGASADLRMEAGGVEVEMSFAASAEIRDLLLEVTLFHITSPDHVDLTSVHWPDGAVDTFGVTREEPRVRCDPTGRGAFVAYLKLGFDHILSGWDHLAFVLVLFLGARSVKSLLGIITAFTVAHSVSLGLATLRIVNVSAYSQFIETIIALSIAYMALGNLFRKQGGGKRWIEAFAFGLIHGLGFAGYLASSLLGERAKGTALFSFNVGVELGQIAVIALLFLALCLGLRRWNRDREESLVPNWARQGLSVAVAGLGMFWFFERL